MAFYTLLLALGAALPVLASYGDAFDARSARPVDAGGQVRPARAADATDDARAPRVGPRGRARALSVGGRSSAGVPALPAPAPAAPTRADARDARGT
ncbi:MAG: hypothetical protein KF729_06495 [Sandaracinaceae bacterium]|nr:hypothetical protein [Sandaracinaceae bacterium]